MQKPFRLKQLVLLLGLLFPAVWCSADDTYSISTDDHSSITIKNGNVQGTPKGSSIQATEVDTWITYGYRHYDPVTGQFLIYTSFETDQDSVCLSHDEMEYYYQNILDIYHQQPFGNHYIIDLGIALKHLHGTIPALNQYYWYYCWRVRIEHGKPNCTEIPPVN